MIAYPIAGYYQKPKIKKKNGKWYVFIECAALIHDSWSEAISQVACYHRRRRIIP